MASNLVLGLVAGTKMAVFTAFLLLALITHRVTDGDWWTYQVAAVAFIAIALVEATFIFGRIAELPAALELFSHYGNIKLINDVLYLIAGVVLFYGMWKWEGRLGET